MLYYPILRLMQAQSIPGSGASGPVHHAFNNDCCGVRQFQEGRKKRRTKATSEGGKGRKQGREWKEGRTEGVGSLRYSPNVGRLCLRCSHLRHCNTNMGSCLLILKANRLYVLHFGGAGGCAPPNLPCDVEL